MHNNDPFISLKMVLLSYNLFDAGLAPMRISLYTNILFMLYDSTSFAYCQDRDP